MRKATLPVLVICLMSLALASVGLAYWQEYLPTLDVSSFMGIDNQQFAKVLEDENVSLWIHGHTHCLHSLPDTRVDRWGTTFIDDGSIQPPDESESLLLIFRENKRKVIVKSRDHFNRVWNKLENKFSFELDHPFEGKPELRVWVWSDSQPVTSANWGALERAIVDANDMQVDFCLLGGDLVDHGEDFEKFKEYLKKSDIPLDNFYSLAGNHEYYPYFTGDLSNYRNKIRDNIRYAIKRGNLLFIFMSDEQPGAPGEIGDDTFEWWENLVEHNQNINIITLTHQPLRGTTREAATGIESYYFKGVLYGIVVLTALLGTGAIISVEVSLK